MEDIPCGDSMLSGKDSIFIFLNDDGEQSIGPDVAFLLIFMFHASLSPVLWQEDAPT